MYLGDDNNTFVGGLCMFVFMSYLVNKIWEIGLMHKTVYQGRWEGNVINEL